MFKFIVLCTIFAVIQSRNVNDHIDEANIRPSSPDTIDIVKLNPKTTLESPTESDDVSLLANAMLIESGTDVESSADSDFGKLLFQRTTPPPPLVLVLQNSSISYNSGAIQNVMNVTNTRNRK